MPQATTEPAALGFSCHSGWAIAVAVTGSPIAPIVLERRRIEIRDTAIAGSKQPFHAAETLPFNQAEALIRRCQESSTRLAKQEVAALAIGIIQRGFHFTCAGIVFASGRMLPGLASILKSHALIHTAEGEFFRQILVEACEHCELPVTRVKQREIWETAADAFRIPLEELQQQISGLRRTLGPPWSSDEKLASIAAWMALECNGTELRHSKTRLAV